MSAPRGHLVLVAGPSGAGKDSVLRGSAQVLSGNRRFVFARRVVTRAADVDAEDHDSMSEHAFNAAIAEGGFALRWQAHGNFYGVSSLIDEDLSAGRIVVMNVSRAILAEAVRRYANVTIAEIAAPQELLVARIVARGRESEEQARLRVARGGAPFPSGVPLVRISNAGAIEDAVEAFVDLLRQLEHAAPDPGGRTLDDKHQQEDRDDDGRGLVIVE